MSSDTTRPHWGTQLIQTVARYSSPGQEGQGVGGARFS